MGGSSKKLAKTKGSSPSGGRNSTIDMYFTPPEGSSSITGTTIDKYFTPSQGRSTSTTDPSSSVSRASGGSYGTPSQRESSPGEKNKREAVDPIHSKENAVNGVIVQPRKKERRTKGLGNVKNSSPRTNGSDVQAVAAKASKRNSDAQIVVKPKSNRLLTTTASKKPRVDTMTLGLARIPSSSCNPTTVVSQEEAQELFQGAIMGRQVTTRPPSAKKSTRLNLGIPNAAIGVSRKHLEVTGITQDSVTIRQLPTAENSVYVCRNNSKEEIEILSKGEIITLGLGDTLELDAYKRTAQGYGEPEHLFRVVHLHKSSPKKQPDTPHEQRAALLESSPTQTPASNKTKTFEESPWMNQTTPGSKQKAPPQCRETMPLEAGSDAQSVEESLAKKQTPSNRSSDDKAEKPSAVATSGDGGKVSPGEKPVEIRTPSDNGKTEDEAVVAVVTNTDAAKVSSSEKQLFVEKQSPPPNEPNSVDYTDLDPKPSAVVNSDGNKVKTAEDVVMAPEVEEPNGARAVVPNGNEKGEETILIPGVVVNGDADAADTKDPPSNEADTDDKEPVSTSTAASGEGAPVEGKKPSGEANLDDKEGDRNPTAVTTRSRASANVACHSTGEKAQTCSEHRNGTSEHELGVPVSPPRIRNGFKPLVVRAPVVGDRFRVMFENSNDLFGKRRPAWYFGSATKVRKRKPTKNAPTPTYEVDLLYDDNATSRVVFPAVDVQRMAQDSDSGVFCAERNNSLVPDEGKIFAYDPDPVELVCGDLVDCRYQNGACSGAFYRGRVAAVSEDMNHCDVAYDDGEYERDIPIENENVHLVKSGPDDCTWVQNLSVCEAFKNKFAASEGSRMGTVEKFGKVDIKDALIPIKFSDGNTEKWTYIDLVSTLFAAHRFECFKKNKVRSWPTTAKDGSLDQLDRTETDSVDEEPALAQDSLSSEQVCEEPEFAQMEQIPTVLGNSLWRALDSSEPHHGADLLQLMRHHGTVPSDALGRELLNLMMNGPRSEGTMFPDPNRMEVGANYVSDLLSDPTAPLPNTMCPATWQDVESCIQQATNGIFCAPDDYTSLDSAASFRRIASSLQLASCAAHMVEAQLKRQLDYHVKNKTAAKSKDYRSKPIVEAILSCPSGIRNAFKIAVRLTTRAWIQNGHFVLGFVNKTDESASAIQSCTMEATHCVKLLGTITSYIAWIYCAEEGIGLGSKKCSVVIKEALLSEMDNSTFDPEPFLRATKRMSKLTKKPEYLKRLKLKFILGLSHKEFSALQSTLAGQLNFAKEYSRLTS